MGEKMNELALFAGAGGGILGGHLLGWRTVCAVERDAYAASVLLARQNDGMLPPFPIWDDVCTFDGRPWRGLVDVVSGGFPCQDISTSGKGAGIDGARSGLWSHMARIVGEVRPRYVFVENSPALVVRGLGRVLSDLASLGYDCQWTVLGAADVGAPHQRDRIWIVAHANGFGRIKDSSDSELRTDWLEQSPSNQGNRGQTQASKEREISDSNGAQREGRRVPSRVYKEHSDAKFCGTWWGIDPADAAESGVGRVAHGVAARVDRLKAIGNGQVPAVAAMAFRELTYEERA